MRQGSGHGYGVGKNQAIARSHELGGWPPSTTVYIGPKIRSPINSLMATHKRGH